MVKELNGREIAGFVKERQSRVVKSLKSQKIFPKLVIIRDSDNPVITKYVNLKKRYGDDIGVEVVDEFVENPTLEKLQETVKKAGEDESVSGIIVQLPLTNPDWVNDVTSLIPAKKDVDGLAKYDGRENERIFDSATATAINWLLGGHNIDLEGKRIAIVGRGKLVGGPLIRMWTNSGYSLEVFHRGSDFSKLKDFDIIVTATGNPHLITSEMIKSGAVIVDAGTASEGGHLVGDISDEIRERNDLGAITPKIGGVGPLTVTVLFEDVLRAAQLENK